MSKKVSELPAATAVTVGDLVMIVQDSTGLSKTAAMSVLQLLFGVLPISDTAVVASADLTIGLTQLYDPSATGVALTFPASPTRGDRVGAKNVTANGSSTSFAGNGNNIEDPLTKTLGSGFITGVSGALFGAEWIYDGTNWVVINQM